MNPAVDSQHYDTSEKSILFSLAIATLWLIASSSCRSRKPRFTFWALVNPLKLTNLGENFGDYPQKKKQAKREIRKIYAPPLFLT